MVRFCESVLDAALLASAIERMTAPHCGGLRTILRQVSELNAVVGKHGMSVVTPGAAAIPICLSRQSSPHGIFLEKHSVA
jgi:hypothetical protein